MLVHVIKHSGARFEYNYPDDAADDRVLSELASMRRVFGHVERHELTNNETGLPEQHENRRSAFAWDHPNCRVVVVVPDGDGVREVRTLKGTKPAPPPAEPS